ncbi:MAG: type VI secretion system baseplate subunit TssG [Gemmatimonadales bacterium]|nr:type VI secretion system baseplate subunit TssG [Gemmatimonadales bacterium]
MTATMPDLCSPRRGVRQTIDAAIPSLLRLGVEMDRISFDSAGPGWVRGTIVGQKPAAGTPLTPESRVVLLVAGVGSIESLPFPMRDTADGEFRIDELFGLFDNHFLRLSHHLRAAGGMLDLHPDDPEGAARWIVEIFRLSSDPWPRERWYDVARLLPALHRIAGRPDGPALALRAVFRIPASPIRLVSGIAPVPPARRTRLGIMNGRLGVDALIGDGVTAHTAVEIDIGPVDLATWRRLQRPGERAQRQALYRLVLPAHLRSEVREHWLVGDRSEPTVLGDRSREFALGVNSYLGSARG